MTIKFKIDPCISGSAKGTFVLDISESSIMSEKSMSMNRLNDLFTRDSVGRLSYAGRIDPPTPVIPGGQGIDQNITGPRWSISILNGSGYDLEDVERFVWAIKGYLREEE